ncbi:MAG: hypothetical protein NZ750_07660 [Anaerolineae bacterium]|nr:hypothetical protein [Anaerolineae bacterium]MDW8172225.1 hypothetical protein [Anaerolineae bacterium]
MNFLRRLFSLGKVGQPANQRHYVVYVRPKACREVVRVTIDLMNDLSLSDGEDGYIVRKLARGARCPFPSEIILRFDRSRALVEREIAHGEWAEQSDYDAFIRANETKP